MLRLGPECVWQRFLWDVSYWSGFVDLAAVWAAQAALPHSVDESESNVAHQEHHSSEDCSVCIYYENEVVNVNHLLGVHRAGMTVKWRGVWTEIETHML